MISLYCSECGEVFKRWPSQRERSKFCSSKCRYAFKRVLTEEHKCKIRTAMKTKSPWTGKRLPQWVLDKLCGPRGERAGNWKGGISKKNFLVAQRRRERIRQNGGTFSKTEWDALKKKFDFRCLSCGEQESKIKLVADHIVPVCNGGINTIQNIQPLCIRCNAVKNRTEICFLPLEEALC